MSRATENEKRYVQGMQMLPADGAVQIIPAEIDHRWIQGAAMDGDLYVYADKSMAVQVGQKYIALRKKSEREYARTAIWQHNRDLEWWQKEIVGILSRNLSDLPERDREVQRHRITLESMPK